MDAWLLFGSAIRVGQVLRKYSGAIEWTNNPKAVFIPARFIPALVGKVRDHNEDCRAGDAIVPLPSSQDPWNWRLSFAVADGRRGMNTANRASSTTAVATFMEYLAQAPPIASLELCRCTDALAATN